MIFILNLITLSQCFCDVIYMVCCHSQRSDCKLFSYSNKTGSKEKGLQSW